MSEFRDYLNEQLQDPEFRKEYEALDPEFAIIEAIIDARTSSGLTQKQISERSGIAQGDISRLENGNGNPSVKTLKRLASAMNMTLKIEFTPLADENTGLVVAEHTPRYKKTNTNR